MCVSGWKPMGKACGQNFLSRSAFPGLFDHSITAWGIGTTNLICQIIDFQRTCRYYVLLLRLLTPTTTPHPHPKLGLPWWLRGERNCLQCWRPGFSPWVRKIPWRRIWQTTQVFLPRDSHGQRIPVGYSPWGHKESDTTEQLTTVILLLIDF